MLLGHEAAGIVEALGDGVDDLGDRRPRRHDLPAPLRRLPRVRDRRTAAVPGGQRRERPRLARRRRRRLSRDGEPVHHHLGVSAFASHAVVSRTSVVRVDPDVPPEVAALLGCAVLTGGGAVVNAGRPREGDTVMVVGLGGVGMAALLVAVALGFEVIGVDALADKLDAARANGAAATYAPAELAAACAPRSSSRPPGNARAFETAFARDRAGRHDRDRRPARAGRPRVGEPADARPPRRGPSSAATSAPPSRRATSRSTSTCGAPGGCRSNASSPPASPCTTSTSPWTASRPVASSAS